MSFWSSLFGKKVHCTGCGVVLPVDSKKAGEDVFCSDACRANYYRLSSLPPPEATETHEAHPVES